MNAQIYFFFSALLILCNSFGIVAEDPNEDAYLTVPQLLKKYGYPAEEHFVTTPDDYILRLHRIPHGKTSNKVSSKVVFLQHGLLCSSFDWIITGPNHALGYKLADQGYDVWMGNARGNSQSRNHTTLDPDLHDSFWDFSFHEIGAVDLPTMIDYVLETTGQKSLYHVGHSEGTTTFYVMTTVNPEYNEKIKVHVGLAPAAFMNHLTSPLMRVMAFWSGSISLFSDLIGVHEFLPSNEFLAYSGEAMCADGEFTQILCTNSLFAMCGFSPGEMNATILPVLMGHTPAGSSVGQFVHYSQEIVSGYFRQYDYGLTNFWNYGSIFPPDYDLSLITTPLYLFYSHNDWIVAEEDVARLCKGVGSSCKAKYLVADQDFNHLDYVYGINAPDLVYSKVLNILSKL